VSSSTIVVVFVAAAQDAIKMMKSTMLLEVLYFHAHLIIDNQHIARRTKNLGAMIHAIMCFLNVDPFEEACLQGAIKTALSFS
jgi:hypothetical protein